MLKFQWANFYFQIYNMRIISGTHKGRRFQVGNKFNARPTTDFAKETLFNVLQNLYDFEDLSILELFSGTGSISYEFASRGAQPILALEKNNKHCEYIKKNIALLGFENHITILKTDIFTYIPRLSQNFDIIFADPPFSLKKLVEIPDLIFKYNLLATDGLFILEHSSDYNFAHHTNFERLVKRGSVHFSFFS